MNETPRTDARLRELVAKWGRGEYADSHIIEDLTDFTGAFERELSAAQAKLAALLKPGEYGDLLHRLRDVYSDAESQLAAAAIEHLQARVRELEESTKVTMVMRLRNQYDEQVKRAEQAEARLAEEIATRAGEMVLLREKLTECQNDANEIVRGFEQGVFIKDTKNYSLHLARDAFPALAALGRATRRKEQT